MVTKKQYLILRKFNKEEVVRQDKFSATEICSEPFNELLSAKFIEGLDPVDICGNILSTKYQITTDGMKAYEEYERAEITIKKARNANIISWVAICVSLLSILASFLIAKFIP